MSKIVEDGIAVLMKKGYGKEKEFEADQSGATYSTVVGYQSDALVDVLSRIDGDPHTKVLSATHPGSAERVAKLKSYLLKNGLENARPAANTATLQKRFEQALKGTGTHG